MTDAIPTVTATQMIEIDRLMIADAKITLVQMMENAGRSLADLAISRYAPTSVMVLAGPGGNGGGALVAARHLANRGVVTTVCLTRTPDESSEVTRHQHRALARTAARSVADPSAADVTIDGLIGYSLKGPPRGRAAELIDWALSGPAPILSLDTPSGIDVTSGEVADPSIRADATLTLALPKSGLVGHPHVGDLYLADISVPPQLYSRIGVTVPPDLFVAAPIREVAAPA